MYVPESKFRRKGQKSVSVFGLIKKTDLDPAGKSYPICLP